VTGACKGKVLRIILLESALELAPKEIWEHPQIVGFARRLGVDVREVILDKTFHYYAMEKLPEKWKRGRPDILHLVLLLLQDSILNISGCLEVYFHVFDGRVFHVEPDTRLPKHLERFKGLMAQLLQLDRVPPNGRPLIYKVADSLEEFVSKYGGLILLWEKGKPASLDHIIREALETGWPIGIGCFPRGDFKKTTIRLAKKRYSLYGGKPLKAWTIAYKLLCTAETILGVD